MSDDNRVRLCLRLRDDADHHDGLGLRWRRDCREAADLIERQAAELGRLRYLVKGLWPYANVRRCQLIDLSSDGTGVTQLAPTDEAELATLQRMADEQSELLYPLPWAKLEELERAAAALGEGKGE